MSLQRKIPTANMSLAYMMFLSKRGCRLYLGILHIAPTRPAPTTASPLQHSPLPRACPKHASYDTGLPSRLN
ncbi:hypothetical protein COCSADRAFT_289462 [Bipolaris sorokiniana ND90Pr]|uniref:Uncharacterized protein n=1 Tax=Cochliobolus sativus (strain ND90Pr / ATCC 201652) TaxID=665912 RepID=M2SJU6_COCSN|nr:uncharacterized protein COCSADRAFT_289462 [Bipolaris sorokiniana ND90Pr]EMD67458.1 hypothetical protein COCSADRAFT_289462 [Bipolaris sorokiniana ND90Pr]